MHLRPPRPDDATAVFAYASDPEVTRYLAWPRHTSVGDSERFLQRAIGGWQDGASLVWLIEDEEGVAGSIGAELSGTNAGIGYVLSRRRWGRGYATEALGLVSAALLCHTPVRRVWAQCVGENSASQRVLDKCGFHYQRTQPDYFSCPNLGGARRDVLLYATTSLSRNMKNAAPTRHSPAHR
ncbi:MAG TPA: GNAT family N-acetyltransferase [Gammaproteobacteria bacterium]